MNEAARLIEDAMARVHIVTCPQCHGAKTIGSITLRIACPTCRGAGLTTATDEREFSVHLPEVQVHEIARDLTVFAIAYIELAFAREQSARHTDTAVVAPYRLPSHLVAHVEAELAAHFAAVIRRLELPSV